jgi:hypothetical protein
MLEKKPTLPPERSLKALTQQLESLQTLKSRKHNEAATDETAWIHMTDSVVEAAFGNPSSEVDRFKSAQYVGVFNVRGESPQQLQHNFERRMQEFEAVLQAAIGAVRLQLPEEEIQGTYDPGDEYAFYKDLSTLVAATVKEMFIVDAYLDEQIFNLYVSKVPNHAIVRILTNKIGPNVETVARMYVKNRPLELRSSPDGHDRVVFLDQRGWVIGQSIKDAAKKKPTYLVELNEPMLTASRAAHEKIWAGATVVI